MPMSQGYSRPTSCGSSSIWIMGDGSFKVQFPEFGKWEKARRAVWRKGRPLMKLGTMPPAKVAVALNAKMVAANQVLTASLARAVALASSRRRALADVMAFAGGLSSLVAPLLAEEG